MAIFLFCHLICRLRLVQVTRPTADNDLMTSCLFPLTWLGLICFINMYLTPIQFGMLELIIPRTGQADQVTMQSMRL